MPQYRKINCPSCGAPGDVDRFAAMAVCEYCSTAFYFEDDAVRERGKMGVLAETPSPLYVGATGTLQNRGFGVVGHVRYRYSDGFWDEWYLRFEDNEGAWIGEDEMEFSLEEPIADPGAVPPFDAIEPGQPLQVGGVEVYVDEKEVATLEGAEGSLPFPMEADRTFRYFDASQGDDTVTVEYTEDGVEAFRGVWIDLDELELDMPNPEDGTGEMWDA
ncbi:MAG: DUF4178 domain-containing protein [Planctomycetota bacterium]